MAKRLSLYKESLEAAAPELLQTYWNGVAFDFTSFFSPLWDSFMTIDFGELILSFALFSALLLWKKNKTSIENKLRLNTKALIITTWLSLLAPLSWFLLFNGHSYIHTHMNFIAWYIPFGILGFSVISVSLSIFLKDLLTKFRESTAKYKVAYLSIPVLVIIGLLAGYSIKGIENEQKIDELLESKPSENSENFDLYLEQDGL